MSYGSLDYWKFVCKTQGPKSRTEKVIYLDKVICFLAFPKSDERTLWLLWCHIQSKRDVLWIKGNQNQGPH